MDDLVIDAEIVSARSIDYRERSHWSLRSWIAIALFTILIVGGYFGVLKPQLAAREVALAQSSNTSERLAQFQKLLRPTDQTVAAVIANEAAMKSNPKFLDALGGRRHDRTDTTQRIDGQNWKVRTYTGDAWYDHYASYPFSTGANIIISQRDTPSSKPYLIAIDVVAYGYVLDFYATSLDLSDQRVEKNARASGINSPLTKRIARFSFTEDACIVYRGVANPKDPAAVSFDVIHGSIRETVQVRLDDSGKLTATAIANSRRENRWELSPAK